MPRSALWNVADHADALRAGTAEFLAARLGCDLSERYFKVVQAEGWYLDPYGIHGDRWYSDGHPTSLVRDDGIESRDAPPSWQPKTAPVPVPTAQSDASDLKRADELDPQDQSFDDRAALASWLLSPLARLRSLIAEL